MHVHRGLATHGLLLLLALPFAIASAGDQNLGVASCAGSTCHGATQAFADHAIRQDEYFIWLRRDPHAKAHETLASPASREIVRKLGLGDPLTAAACTGCHLHAPPAAEQGPRFLLSDGIGCEACHGAAERWIGPHVNALPAERRQALGMTATWDRGVRAQLCASCHLGDEQRPIAHAIMGAGHPPLLFELDTFTALEPPHWDVDADYIKRKGTVDPAGNWISGQMQASRQFLQGLSSARFEHGLFPELAFFDCNACHHSLEQRRWTPGRPGGLAPGAVPLADNALSLVGEWLAVMAPAQAGPWRAQLSTLQNAAQHDRQRLRSTASQMLATLAAYHAADTAPTAAQLHRLLSGLARTGLARPSDYALAEQTAMASAVFATALETRGQGASPALRSAIDGVYAAVRARDGFDPARYSEALRRLLRVIETAG